MLFTECENFAPFKSYGPFTFLDLKLYIGKSGAIFSYFFTYFSYKITNIDFDSPKFFKKLHFIEFYEVTNLTLKIFEILG